MRKWTQEEFYAEVEKTLMQMKMPFKWQEMDKINVKRKGIIIGDSTGKSNVALPVIYVDQLYGSFQYESSGPALAVKEILDMLDAHKNQMQMISQTFWDVMKKENIHMTVINKDWNEHLLKSCPHIEREDLAIVFEYETEEFSVKINQQIMEMNGFSVDELYSIALENLIKDGYSIKSMYQMVNEMMPNLMQNEEFDNSLYVVTNRKLFKGAATMMHPDVMIQISEKTGWKKFYILPSSIHEILILPWNMKTSPSDLSEMVREINEMCVEPSERLSNHVYLYDSSVGKVTIA